MVPIINDFVNDSKNNEFDDGAAFGDQAHAHTYKQKKLELFSLANFSEKVLTIYLLKGPRTEWVASLTCSLEHSFMLRRTEA